MYSGSSLRYSTLGGAGETGSLTTFTAARAPNGTGNSGHGTIAPYRIEAPGRSVGRTARSSAARICVSSTSGSVCGEPVTSIAIVAGIVPAGGSTTGGVAYGAGLSTGWASAAGAAPSNAS